MRVEFKNFVLPVFQGFYNTPYDYMEMYFEDDDGDEVNIYDVVSAEAFREFQEMVIRNIATAIIDELNVFIEEKFGIDLEMQFETDKLICPEDYEYNNDQIIGTFYINKEELTELLKKIKQDTKFLKYLASQFESEPEFTTYNKKWEELLTFTAIRKNNYILTVILTGIAYNYGESGYFSKIISEAVWSTISYFVQI